MQKNIIKLEHPRNYHMVGDGFRVTNYIPGYHSDMDESTSPFLMLDYNAPWHIPPQLNHRPGVGFHPHRGFETVTIVYSGEIEHQDTAWNGWVIGADGVQWMTAWSGLLHNEFMTKQFSSQWGIQHAVQLWVNLPQKYKMTNPEYQALTRDNIPEVEFEWWRARIIAGKLWDISGAARTFSPIELYDIRFNGISRFDFAIPEEYTTMILVTEWNVTINGKPVENGDMIHLSKKWEDISISSDINAKILVMAGKPLGESISHYGPFVMNTPQEIEQAFVDLRAGKMWKLDN